MCVMHDLNYTYAIFAQIYFPQYTFPACIQFNIKSSWTNLWLSGPKLAIRLGWANLAMRRNPIAPSALAFFLYFYVILYYISPSSQNSPKSRSLFIFPHQSDAKINSLGIFLELLEFIIANWEPYNPNSMLSNKNIW